MFEDSFFRRRGRYNRPRPRAKPPGVVPTFVLCALAAFMLVRSFVVEESVSFRTNRPATGGRQTDLNYFHSSGGALTHLRLSGDRSDSADAGGVPQTFDYQKGRSLESLPGDRPVRGVQTTSRFLGFRRENWATNDGQRVQLTVVPYWMLLVLFGLFLWMALAHRRRTRLQRTAASVDADPLG
jgi:hypothetical protein